MKLEDENLERTTGRKLVLAPGAADASEGLVYLDEDSITCCPAPLGESCSYIKSDLEYECYSEQQPGEGFWSVAPGCGDISEGRVWVAVVRKN